MTAPKPRPTEIEIKFLLPDGDPAALDGHPMLRGCEAGPPSRETTTYFDTADRAFARAGARVALLDRDEAAAGETLRLLDEAGAEGVVAACDVSDERSVRAGAAAVRWPESGWW